MELFSEEVLRFCRQVPVAMTSLNGTSAMSFFVMETMTLYISSVVVKFIWPRSAVAILFMS